jgi:hypothetical protein
MSHYVILESEYQLSGQGHYVVTSSPQKVLDHPIVAGLAEFQYFHHVQRVVFNQDDASRSHICQYMKIMLENVDKATM